MSPNKCVNCGLVNFRSEPSCARCGAYLGGQGRAEPFFPGCPSCGSPVSVTDQNCPACRRPLAQVPRRVEPLPARPAPPPPQAPSPQPRPRNLAPCPDCGHMVSTAALACPGCGRPFTQPAAPAPLSHHAPHAFLAPQYQPVYIQPPRSRALFVVLAIFLGCLGIHNFYAGHNGRGAAQLIITLLTGCGGGFFLTAIWALVECVVVDTDSTGRRMT